MLHNSSFARPGTLALVVCLSACSGGSSSSSGTTNNTAGAGTGSLSVSVTDAPFNINFVDSATVEINQIEVHEAITDTFVTVFNGSATIDLIQLIGVSSVLVNNATVPAGTYDEVRLRVNAGEVVLDASAVVAGGTHIFNTQNGNLFFPSGAQTGIKAKVDPPIVVNPQLSSELLLDFDANKNFVFNGPADRQPGVRRVLFTPVVKGSNVSTAGRVVVDVVSDNATPADATDDPAIAGATVSVIDTMTMTTVNSGPTDTLGHAEVTVSAGAYDVQISATVHKSTRIMGVTVLAGNATVLPLMTLEAAGEVIGTITSDPNGTPADTSDDVPVAGATISLLDNSGTVTATVATTTSASDGTFALTELDAGTFDVLIDDNNGNTTTVTGVSVVLLSQTTVDALLP